MIRTPVSAVALIAAGLAAPAFAQDGDSPYFDGFYVGGSLGLDGLKDSRDDGLEFDTDGDGTYGDPVTTVTGANAFAPGFCNGDPVGSQAAQGCGDDHNDLGYAVRVGFDKRINGGPFVAGLLVEGAMSDSTDHTTGFSTTPASYTVSRGLDYSAALRGRLGVSPGDGRGLFYVTGGVAYGRIDHNFTTTNGVNSFTEVNDSKMQLGGQVGAGAELMVTDNVSFGLEYLYSRYDDEDYRVDVGAGTAPATNPFLLDSGGTSIRPTNGDLNIHSIRATVGFHF